MTADEPEDGDGDSLLFFCVCLLLVLSFVLASFADFLLSQVG